MNSFLKVILAVSLVFSHFLLLADGSKDFYPRGVQGNRAYLLSANKATGIHPFINEGKHFVYAKLGETIATASSTQGFQSGRIVVISPNGERFVTDGSDIGQIKATNSLGPREAELAGPRVGYTPYEIPVHVEGIWTVEFFSLNSDDYRNTDVPNVFADGDWTQPTDNNLIAAWDISVRDKEDASWVRGRVYANVLNFHISSAEMNNSSRSFYGQNYVLTKDGYIYKVDGNGSNGLRFTYFVNNSGILDGAGNSSYKSSNDGFFSRVHHPENIDLGNQYITHKLFYTFPDLNMPASSRLNSTSTWLVNEIEIAHVSNIKFIASEGTSNNVNIKNNYIEFETNFPGKYKISIKEKDSNFSFKSRQLIVDATAGKNRIYWDGKDGDGNLLPIGKDYPILISIGSIEGEIHFPYFDMEINPNGILVERVNRNGMIAGSAIMYWDDSEITRGIPSEESNPLVNLDGIPSNMNGHRWGSYTTTIGNQNFNTGTGAASFGNNKAMDTWSYSVQVEEEIETDITVNVADLEVVSVKPNKDTIELEELVTYEIEIKNNGPSDAIDAGFTYSLPVGFIIRSITSTGNCGSLSGNTMNQNNFSSLVTLQNGCSLHIIFTASTGRTVPDETYGYVEAIAALVRAKGYYDPDATSPREDLNLPGSAFEECQGDCNNIKINNEVFLLEPYNERGQIAFVKTVRHIDSNSSGFQEIGEQLEYTFTVRNIGFVNLSDIYITDSLLYNQPFFVTSSLSPNEEVSISRTYVITANDVRNRLVKNSASILAKNPRSFDVKDISGTTFSNDLPTLIHIDQRPSIYLKKTVLNQGTGERNQFTLDDVIEYQFEIKSAGYIPIQNLQLQDIKLFSNLRDLQTGVDSSKNLIFKFSYRITQEDISNGKVENTAIVSGFDSKYGIKISDTSGTSFENDEKTITPTAKEAVAVAEEYVLYQGNSASFEVLKNDVLGSSSIGTNGIEIVDQPTFGSIIIQNGQVVYTPLERSYYGNDSFTYRIIDLSRLRSNIVEVKISILQTIPIAVDDKYYLMISRSLKIRPFENDYVEHSTIVNSSLQIISNPLNGVLNVDANGDLVYTPGRLFTGFDEFQYIIQDENGNWSEPATVTLETKGLLIPNTITPNGDGINDHLEILGIYDFDRIELDVFDRFGRMIYQSMNFKNDWYVDSSVNEGTYFYLFRGFKSGHKTEIFKGYLLIIKNAIQ